MAGELQLTVIKDKKPKGKFIVRGREFYEISIPDKYQFGLTILTPERNWELAFDTKDVNLDAIHILGR
jgi:hypothetical protein